MGKSNAGCAVSAAKRRSDGARPSVAGRRRVGSESQANAVGGRVSSSVRNAGSKAEVAAVAPAASDGVARSASSIAPEASGKDAAATETRKGRAKKGRAPKKRRLWLRVLVSVLLALVLLAVAAFSWQHWLRYDDASDFQGTWYVEGSSTGVSIDAEAINLNEEVAYGYGLDSWSKTLSFTFGAYSGSGRYQFSLDRQTLVIEDGSYSWLDAVGADVALLWEGLVAAVQDGQLSLPEGDDLIVLTREPTSAADGTASVESSEAEGFVDEATAEETDAAVDADGDIAATAASSDSAAGTASSGEVA